MYHNVYIFGIVRSKTGMDLGGGGGGCTPPQFEKWGVGWGCHPSHPPSFCTNIILKYGIFDNKIKNFRAFGADLTFFMDKIYVSTILSLHFKYFSKNASLPATSCVCIYLTDSVHRRLLTTSSLTPPLNTSAPPTTEGQHFPIWKFKKFLFCNILDLSML